MTLILADLTKVSSFNPTMDEKEHRRLIDQDLQRLFIGLRPDKVFTLTDAATIETDATRSFHFRVTLGGNRTLGNPTSGRDGQKLMWEIIQDSTGNRTLTFDTKFVFGSDIPDATLTTSATYRDFIGAVYNSVTDKWYVIALARGYA